MSDEGRRQWVDVSLEAERADGAREREPGGPFRLLVVGDFSGRGFRDDAEPRAAVPAPVRVDRDTFEDVMAHVAPRVDVAVPPNGQPAVFAFRELEDFHPDRLYERQPYFKLLGEEWRRRGASAEAPAGPARPPVPDRPRRMTSQLLEQMIAEMEERPDDPVEQSYDLASYMQKSLRQVRTSAPTLEEQTRQRLFAANVEGRLRGVLHSPGVRAVEALWRALDLLVRRVPDDVLAHVFLLDVTRGELAAALRGEGGARLPRGPWSAQVVLDAVDDAPDDVLLLSAMAAAGERTRTPWLIGGGGRALGVVGAEEADEGATWVAPSAAWNALRAEPGARWVSVVAPRIVLRLPYGRRDDACERVVFEEMQDAGPDAYLWGSGALAAAVALVRGVEEDGGPSSRRPFVLDGLPLPIRRAEGSVPEAVPVTEWMLTDRLGEAAAARGVTPLLAARDADRLLIPGIRSIATGGEPLAGPWNATLRQ